MRTEYASKTVRQKKSAERLSASGKAANPPHHAKESCNECAGSETERGDADAQVEPEERVAVRVEDELDARWASNLVSS